MTASLRRDDLLRGNLEAFTRTLHGVSAGKVRAVHRARVASRRLRELLPLLHLDRELREKLGKRLRRVRRALGRARELDVLLMVIDELRPSDREAFVLAQIR